MNNGGQVQDGVNQVTVVGAAASCRRRVRMTFTYYRRRRPGCRGGSGTCRRTGRGAGDNSGDDGGTTSDLRGVTWHGVRSLHQGRPGCNMAARRLSPFCHDWVVVYGLHLQADLFRDTTSCSWRSTCCFPHRTARSWHRLPSARANNHLAAFLAETPACGHILPGRVTIWVSMGGSPHTLRTRQVRLHLINTTAKLTAFPKRAVL